MAIVAVDALFPPFRLEDWVVPVLNLVDRLLSGEGRTENRHSKSTRMPRTGPVKHFLLIRGWPCDASEGFEPSSRLRARSPGSNLCSCGSGLFFGNCPGLRGPEGPSDRRDGDPLRYRCLFCAIDFAVSLADFLRRLLRSVLGAVLEHGIVLRNGTRPDPLLVRKGSGPMLAVDAVWLRCVPQGDPRGLVNPQRRGEHYGEESTMHDHGHAHGTHAESSERRIGTAFFLNLAFTVVEIGGGLWTNSLAVLSDALHDLGDSIALALSWRFARMAGRAGDEVYTFGYRRFSLLGVLVMSVVLFAGGLFVLFESVPRLLAPEQANAQGMLILAVVGIVVNGAAAIRMRGGGSLGERVVTWHFVEDILGWVAVLIAGIVMTFRNVPILDPILSLLITVYVLWNVGKRFRETLVILLQGVPEGVTVEDVENAIRNVPGVCDVHHTHLWSQDGEHHVLTGHVVVASAGSYAEIAALRATVKEALERFGVQHATLEFETVDGPTCDRGCAECRAP